jgi:hypothetical protein
MALKIIGAVGVKVRPEAKNFRDEAERDLRRQLGDGDSGLRMKVHPEMDETRIRQDFDRHKKAMQKELDRIGKELEIEGPRLKSSDATRELATLRKHAQRDARAMAREIGNLEGIQKDLTRELKNEREVREWINKEMKQYRKFASGSSTDLEMQREYTKSLLRQDRINKDLLQSEKDLKVMRDEAARSAQKNAELEENALLRVRSELSRLRRDRDERLGLVPATNDYNRLEAQLRDNERIESAFRAHQERLRREAERTRREIDGKKATLNVDLDQGAARAKMAWLTRPRTVPIHVRVSTKSLLIAEGILRSMAGINALSKMGTMLESSLRNFDKFTIVVGAITSGILNLTNAAAGGVAALFGLGQGVAQTLQGIAMAPTFLGAFATSMIVAVTATKDFFSALSSGDYGLLDGNALKNAQMLEGTWTRLSDAIKEDFWTEAGISMGRFVNRALPTLERGLRQTARGMGSLWNETFRGLEDALDLGYYDRMFDGLSGMMHELAGAAGPAMRAIMQLGARGSEYLPRLGEWLREGAEGFERFIAEADKAGRIDQWIENSVQGLKDLGNVARGTWDIMAGFSTAALAAGAADLTTFGNAMRKWGEAVRSAQGQFILGEIFEGALQGLSRLGEGMGNFFSTLGDHISWIKEVEIAAGGIGGAVFDSLATIFDNAEFRGGTLQALNDIGQAVHDLNPAFDSAASLVGNLGRVAGAVFKGIAPSVNAVVGLVSDVVGELSGPLINAIPRITAGMGALIDMIGPGVTGATKAVGGLIDGFNGLPGPIQSALLTAGGLFLMRGHIRSAADAVVGRLLPAYSQWGRGAREVQEAAAAQGKQISLLRGATSYFREEMAASAIMARQQGTEISRTASAFAAFDRITGSSMYGVYEGTRTAGRGVRELGSAVRGVIRPVETFAQSSQTAAGAVQRSFARMYTSTRNLATSLPAIGPLFSQLGAGIARDAERGRGGIQRLTRSLVGFNQQMSQIAGAGQARSFTTMIGGINDAGRKAAGGLRTMASGAGQAVAAIGKTAGTGLRAAATGLMGAMGGPWGLALAGAATAVGVIAQQSSEANQRIQAFQSTLRTDGTASADTFALAADRAGQKTKTWGMSFLTAGETFYDVASEIGVSNKTLTEAFAGNEAAIDSTRKALDAWRDAGNGGFTDMSGWANSAAALEKELSKVETEAQTARDNLQSMADATGVTSDRYSYLSGALNEFGQAARAGAMDGKTLLSTVDELSGGTLAAADAAYNYQVAMNQTKSALQEWGKVHGGSVGAITEHWEKAGATWDMTKQSQMDLYAVLRNQVEPAYQGAAEAFNRATAAGEDGAKAAGAAMGEYRDQLMTVLTDSVGMSEQAAGQMLDSLNIKPDAVELVLDAGTAQENLEAIKILLEQLTGTNTVKMVSDGVAKVMTETEAVKSGLEQMSGKDWNANLSIDGYESVKGKIDTIAEQDSVFDMLVHLAAQDDASVTVEMVRGLLQNGYDSHIYTATLEAIDNASGISEDAANRITTAITNGNFEAAVEIANKEGLDDLASQLAEIGGLETTAEVDADTSKAREAGSEMQGILDNLDTTTALPSISLSGISEALGSLGDFDSSMMSLNSVTATPTVGVDDQATGPTMGINELLSGFSGRVYETYLRATDQITPTAATAMAALGPISGAVATAQIMADNQASPEIEAARSAGSEFDGQAFSGELGVNDNATDAITRVKFLMAATASLNTTIQLNARDNASPIVQGVRGVLQALAGARFQATISANASPAVSGAASARAALTAAARGSYRATLTANASPAIGQATAARGQLMAVAKARYQAIITANAAPAISGARAATMAIRSVPDKTANVRASVSGLGAVQALRAAIASVRSKTVTVTVNRRGSVAMADGGLIESGVQTFANGGITQMGKVLDNRLRFMAENHTAQIAHAGAMRLWAEPETGGEAYIPLSASKRSRSEDILDQVATRFGGEYRRPGATSHRSIEAERTGDTYNITLPTVERDAADEVAEDLTFHLKHMRRGGGAGGAF